MTSWRRLGWLDIVPEALAGAAVLVAGVWAARRTVVPVHLDANGAVHADSRGWLYLIAAIVALAVGLCRRLPSASLVLLVLAGAIHLQTHSPFLVFEVVTAAVMFGAARWGRATTAGLALVFAGFVGAAGLVLLNTDYFGSLVEFVPASVARTITSSSRSLRVAYATVGGLLLIVPWLLGLVLRLLARAISARDAAASAELDAQRAQREAAQAQEIARLQEGQAQLARDVHDVVGHSLAVILAQAESAQYLSDGDRLQRTLTTIAESARASLQSVRQVLRDGEARPGDLEQLIEGVRAAGHDITTAVTGRPRPLPPELETVAYRVLQEMLTNALRHGRRGATLDVAMDWSDLLTLRASNPADVSDLPGSPGAGLEGMRRRVEAVGGTLSVAAGDPFVVTARIPVSGR